MFGEESDAPRAPSETLAWAHTALNITKRCNQRCIFCFEGRRETWTEPPLEEVKRLLSTAARDHRHVVFMGAEALLRPDILEVLRFCRSLGLWTTAFTNGQVLARDGFVERLAEAGLDGLEISFHYTDAESFARGTRTPARFFERLLRGLRNVRDFHRRAGARRLHVKVETQLFRYNYRKLAALRARLDETLGEARGVHRLGSLNPSEGASPEPWLEPLAGRREELVEFCATHAGRGRLVLARLPLCMAPGWEHLSGDVLYKLREIEARSNFADKGRLGALHEYREAYLANPYRWVCARCNLLAICTTQRTWWFSRNMPPRRDQMPQPVLDRTVEDVLRNLMEEDENPHESIAKARRFWRSLPIPEERVVRAVREVRVPGWRVRDVFVSGRPLFDVEAVAAGRPLRLRLEPIGGVLPCELRRPVRYLDAVVVRPRHPPIRTLEAALRRLARAPLPPLRRWEGYAHGRVAAGRAVETAWRAFGTRVWRGHVFARGWTTRRLTLCADHLRLVLESASGPRV